MEIDELLRELRIEEEPVENENGSYTIDIPNSNEYSRYMSKLDKADFLEHDEEASQADEDNASLQYVNDDFVITLLADFENDEYKMVIRQMNN